MLSEMFNFYKMFKNITKNILIICNTENSGDIYIYIYIYQICLTIGYFWYFLKTPSSYSRTLVAHIDTLKALHNKL